MNERQATWRNVGKDVSACTDYHTVLNDAGLDYRVVKKPGRIRVNGREIRTGDYYTIRKDDPSHIYGRVSEKYRIIQNEEAFSFADHISSDLSFLKAGETKIRHNFSTNSFSGGMVYMIAKLPEVDILGDCFSPNLIMSNDFSGNMSMRVAICYLRIICENQFSLAYRDAKSALFVRHTEKGVIRGMEEGQIIMKNYADSLKAFTKMAEGYACMKISPRQIGMVLDAMFPVKTTEPPEVQARVAREKERFVNAFTLAYNAKDNYYFRGTAWGLINAYTDVITHQLPAKKNPNWEENRFVNVTFGSDASKFIGVVDDVAV